VKKQQTLMWNDFNETTEAKKDVAAVKARKTPKSKNDNSFGTAKKTVKKQSTHENSTDEHLETTLHKLQEANLTLNKEKCEFSKPSVEFLGSVINSEGVRFSPKKVEAILEMEAPKDQSELRRFLGMINQLSKFQPQTTELSKPLRDILSSKNNWICSEAQQQAFSQGKPHFYPYPCQL